MSTIKDPSIIAELLRNNGVAYGDPPVAVIYSYTHISSPGEHFAIFHKHSHDDMHLSPYVEEFSELFSDGVMTISGLAWLAQYEEDQENAQNRGER